MGYTVRTAQWRYTEWPRWRGSLQPDWAAVEGVELYSHEGDDGSCVDCFELQNVASDAKHVRTTTSSSAALCIPLAPLVAWNQSTPRGPLSGPTS